MGLLLMPMAHLSASCFPFPRFVIASCQLFLSLEHPEQASSLAPTLSFYTSTGPCLPLPALSIPTSLCSSAGTSPACGIGCWVHVHV